jgi:hypothetical protein
MMKTRTNETKKTVSPPGLPQVAGKSPVRENPKKMNPDMLVTRLVPRPALKGCRLRGWR